MSTLSLARGLALWAAWLAFPIQAAWTDNNDGTVTDTVTGLMWDQCTWGQTFDAGAAGGKCAAGGSAATQNWATALTRARTANAAAHRGYRDWRVPSLKELESLVQLTRINPSIDPTAFPNTLSSLYWSASVYAPSPANAWSVNFSSGFTDANPQSSLGLRVRLVRSGQSFGAFDVLQPCGDGLAYTAGQWLMLAAPCTPTSPTVGDTFGNSPTANFALSDYDAIGTGWVMYSRDVTSTPSAYAKLTTSTNLEPTAKGYWLKSGTAPMGDRVTIASGAATPATTGITGCQSANGCAVVPVQTVTGGNRYNLVGNPFPYAVDWSKVRVRVGGSGGAIYTPSEAAGLAASGNANPPVMGNQIWIWNGTNYDNWDDTTNPGNLKYFQSFWVNVLPGAAGQTVELLIPAEVSTHGRLDAGPAQALAAAPLPWYLGWLDWVVSPAQAADTEWQVRLGVENRVTGWKDSTNLLGQKLTAQTGYDRHDLIGMAPFATPYLSLVFPHADWPALNGQKRAGDYDTDFRPAQGNPPTNWTFELRGNPVGGKVFITWQGDPAALKRSRLVDLQTGLSIDPTAAAYAQGYPVGLQQKVQRYQWRYYGP